MFGAWLLEKQTVCVVRRVMTAEKIQEETWGRARSEEREHSPSYRCVVGSTCTRKSPFDRFSSEHKSQLLSGVFSAGELQGKDFSYEWKVPGTGGRV